MLLVVLEVTIASLLVAAPSRHARVRLCDDAALENFLSEPHPRVASDELSVFVSETEQRSELLSEATLASAQSTLEEYGVVCLRGAWDAKPKLVSALNMALTRNYEECLALVAARTGLAAEDSFGYRQVVHRSAGRYDMLLEDDVAAAPLPRELTDAVLGADDSAQQHWRRQLLDARPRVTT